MDGLVAAAPVGLVRAEQAVHELLVVVAVEAVELELDDVLDPQAFECFLGDLVRRRRAPEAGLFLELVGLLELLLGVADALQHRLLVLLDQHLQAVDLVLQGHLSRLVGVLDHVQKLQVLFVHFVKFSK